MRSSNKTKIHSTFKKKLNDFDHNVIRRKVHEFWFKKQLPTLDNISAAKRGRNSALIEREDIVLWRTKYIEDIHKY